MIIPKNVQDAVDKLESSDKETVLSYINEIHEKLGDSNDDDKDDSPEQPEAGASDEEPFPPVYESGEDFDAAGTFKQEAADLKSTENWEGALEKYTAAVLAAPPSALLLANRAICLLALNRPAAAARDCDLALKENPDSAKALRTRGKARKILGQWEGALSDLSASQQIDFDSDAASDLKELAELRVKREKEEAATRNQHEEKLRKKAADIKQAQEDAKREAEEEKAAGAMPDMGARGMPGGMGGMGGGMPAGMEGLMGSLMSDPELVAAMQKPKVQKVFQELMSGGGPAAMMSNPGKLAEMMSDPDVGPVIKKLMEKMGGMPGGMGGSSSSPGGGDDSIPDMDDIPDLE